MEEKWWERPTCFLCDYGWAVLLVLVLSLAAFFTRNAWLPWIGLAPSQVGLERVSMPVPGGQDLTLTLSDGASLTLPAGSARAGLPLTLTRLPQKDWPDLEDYGLLLGPVVDIDLAAWDPGMQASLTLPVDIHGLNAAELEQVSLATFRDGYWIEIPSTVDADLKQVSATLDHFSLYAAILRLDNQAPQLNVATSPQVYASIPIERRVAYDLPDLDVYIDAYDPEQKPLRVALAFGYQTLAGWAVDEMNAFRREQVQHVMIETALDSLGESLTDMQPAVALVGASAWQIFLPPEDQPIRGEALLISPFAPGKYHARLDVHGLFSTLPADGSPVTEIHVYVAAWDELDGAPVTRKLVIPVTTDDMPVPPLIQGPGAGGAFICPPQPVFRWQFDDIMTIESYRFRLVKGSNLWGWLKVAEWDAVEGQAGFMDQSWTPGEPLKKGEYTWGMAVSNDRLDTHYNDPALSSRTAPLHFSVDPRLSGSECIPADDTPPAAPQPTAPAPQPPAGNLPGVDFRAILAEYNITVPEAPSIPSTQAVYDIPAWLGQWLDESCAQSKPEASLHVRVDLTDLPGEPFEMLLTPQGDCRLIVPPYGGAPVELKASNQALQQLVTGQASYSHLTSRGDLAVTSQSDDRGARDSFLSFLLENSSPAEPPGEPGSSQPPRPAETQSPPGPGNGQESPPPENCRVVLEIAEYELEDHLNGLAQELGVSGVDAWVFTDSVAFHMPIAGAGSGSSGGVGPASSIPRLYLVLAPVVSGGRLAWEVEEATWDSAPLEQNKIDLVLDGLAEFIRAKTRSYGDHILVSVKGNLSSQLVVTLECVR